MLRDSSVLVGQEEAVNCGTLQSSGDAIGDARRKRAPRVICPNCQQWDKCEACRVRYNQKQNARKNAARAACRCVWCGAPSADGKQFCETHAEHVKARRKVLRASRREREARLLESARRAS